MWGGRKGAQPAVKDSVGEAGLKAERGRICLHRWQWHCSALPRFSTRSFSPCSSVLHPWRSAGSPPAFLTRVLLCLEQPNCCKSQNLLLLSSGRGIHLKGAFRRESQITSNISTYFTDLFVLASEIPVRNEHLMAESFIIFLNSFMAAFPMWEYVCVLE